MGIAFLVGVAGFEGEFPGRVNEHAPRGRDHFMQTIMQGLSCQSIATRMTWNVSGTGTL